MSQNIIVLIGPPGGGKGSLSKLCIENLGWLQLSTGNLCREQISRKTEVGKKIDFIIKSGKLISDDLIIEMVDDWLSNNLIGSKSIIFDGYPRTIVQVKILYDLLNEKFRNFKFNLIRLLVDEQVLVQRLSSRLVCSNSSCQAVYSSIVGSSLEPKKVGSCDKCKNILIQRDDDKLEAIVNRLHLYRKSEEELLEYCSKIGFSVLEIDAERPIEDVFSDFRKLVI